MIFLKFVFVHLANLAGESALVVLPSLRSLCNENLVSKGEQTRLLYCTVDSEDRPRKLQEFLFLEM